MKPSRTIAAVFVAVATFAAPASSAPDDADAPAEDLKLTAKPSHDVYLLGYDPVGNGITLTFTLTNTGKKPLKLDMWITSRMLAVDLRGPDGAPVRWERQPGHGDVMAPRPRDFRVLQPEESVSVSRIGFPRHWHTSTHGPVYNQRTTLRQTGRYTARFTWKADTPPHLPEGLRPLFDGCWRGEVTSSRLAFDVLDAKAEGPQPIDVLLRLLHTGGEGARAWAAAKLGDDPTRGVPALARVLDEPRDPSLRIFAAYGLHTHKLGFGRVQRESSAPPALKEKAEQVMLSALAGVDTPAALARRFYTPGDAGLRWLVKQLRQDDASENMKIHGLHLLARHGSGTFATELRAICASAADDDAVEVRRSAAYGLTKLPWKTSDLPVFTKLARDRDVHVRVKAFRVLSGRGRHDAGPLLLEGLKDEYTDIRRKCVLGLAAGGNPRVVPALIAMLKDTSQTRRSFPEAYRLACESVVKLLELEGYDFAVEVKDGRRLYRRGHYRTECARLLEWWDREGEQHLREKTRKNSPRPGNP